jgi:hypothetical protein
MCAVFFFDGAPSSASGRRFAEESSSQYVVDFLSTTEGLHLNRAFARIRDPKVRKRVLDLVTTHAEQSEPARE